MKVTNHLADALADGGELSILAALAEYPGLIYSKFERVGGHRVGILKEFPFGAKFRSGFIVAVQYSGACNIPVAFQFSVEESSASC